MNNSFSFKGITFVLLIFALVLSEGAGAQNVVYSRTRTLEKPHGEDVFIRFFGNSGDMLVHNYDYSLKANVFTCRKAPTHPASNKIVIPLESNHYGEVKYKVLDMVVVGKMCFYCGRKEYVTGMAYFPNGQPYAVFESKGFVGQISLDHITAEQGGKAARRMTEISWTKEIARIDAWISPTSTTDTLLAMVGITLDDKSCLVIAKDSNTGFKYMRYTSSDDTEEFTDIAFTEGQLLVASRFMNENYLLGFREALARHVYKDTVIGLYTLFTFNTESAYDNDLAANPTWHTDDVDIRLSPLPGWNRVNVAYESFTDNPGAGLLDSYTTVFRMQLNVPYEIESTSDIHVLNLQYVQSGVKGPGSFADMLTMDERHGVALVHRDMYAQPSISIVQFAPWDWWEPLRSYKSGTDYVLTSLAKNGEDLLWAAGHRPGHQDSVTLFHQNLAYHIGSCYSMPIYQHDELPVDKADISTVDLVDENWIDAIPTLWNTLYALPTSIEQRCLSGNYIIIHSEDETETE